MDHFYGPICHFAALLNSPSPHSLSLYRKEQPGYSLKNIFIHVLRMKESHTGLERYDSEYINNENDSPKNYNFLVHCSFKTFYPSWRSFQNLVVVVFYLLQAN